jgi:hypothetical protein
MQLGKELATGFVADDAQATADEQAGVAASGADAQAPGPAPSPDPEPEPAAAG